jgi:TRAP-type C4-dicarboxylate transport system substrate-binding protein
MLFTEMEYSQQSQVSKFLLVKQFAATLLLFALATSVSAQTIKIATLAPEGTSWMIAMRAGAAEIRERTDERVKFKFYGGGVQGNDKQVVRKMRIGQLHGGAFTSNALGVFQKDAQVYALPMLFNNLEEVTYVRERLDTRLRGLLEEAGYVNFGFAGGGFAHIMSKQPISNQADIKGLKVWVPDGDAMSYGAVKAMGVSPVTMPLTDVLTGLQTELIDTIMGPPAGTIVLQWNTAVNYITELPLAYIFAMLVIEKKVFNRLQPGDQAIVREVMERVYLGFDEQGEADNKAAYQALLDDGMKSVKPDIDQLDAWYGNVQKSNRTLAGEGVVSLDLLLELECYVAAYRAGELDKDCGDVAR